MTVTNPVNKSEHVADGVNTSFTYTFFIAQADDLQVYLVGTRQTSGYTVNGVGDPNGGNVVFDTAPDNGIVVSLLRVVDLTQVVDYQEYDPFPAETHEGALDKLTFISQQQQEELSRAIKQSLGSEPGIDYTMPTYNAGKGWMWDEAQKRIVTSNDNLNGIVSAANASANAAAASASAANASAGNASNSESKAQQWADANEDVVVEAGKYSAKHWAAKAEKARLEQEAVLTWAASQNWDWADSVNSRVAKLTLNGATTLNLPTNGVAGMSAILKVVVGSAGASLNLSAFDFGDAGPPSLPTTLNSEYILGFYCAGASAFQAWAHWRKTA